MSIRTGGGYLDGLQDSREIRLGGERIKDVTTHPLLLNAAGLRRGRPIAPVRSAGGRSQDQPSACPPRESRHGPSRGPRRAR